MDGKNHQTAYRSAIEQAEARLDQLNREIENLNNRQKALLGVSKALEAMMNRGMEHRPTTDQNPSAVVQVNHPVVGSNQPKAVPSTEPLTRVYVHRGDSGNDIQRRIDMAIGR